MKRLCAVQFLLLFIPFAQAADVAAGKAKVAGVCAACHGAEGVSVSDTIPNLAGQRAVYLETQLKALKDGSRKNPIMNAMAGQLTADEIANVSAYFASLAGAPSGAKSQFLPHLAKTHVTFPESYRATFTKYHGINFPVTKQVRYYFANPVAIQAARAGKALPDGSIFLVEVYAAKLDADGKPLVGDDNLYVADKLVGYTAMSRDAGWGNDVPDMLRNENWNYALFTAEKQHRPTMNQAECLACHKPLDKVSYTFTLKELTAAAAKK